MNRRGFLGVLLGAAVAPKTTFAPKAPVQLRSFVGSLLPHQRVAIMKLYSNSLYGKFAA